MSKETILKIREAEDEAARVVARANEQARAMREAAQAEGEALCRSTEQEVSAELAAMLDQIRQKTAEMSAHLIEETRDRAEAVAATARLNRRSAEKIVIRGLDAKCR